MLKRVHELNAGLGNSGLSGLSGKPLAGDLLSPLLGLDLLGVVLPDTLLEGFSALTLLEMLDSDVESLVNDSSSDTLVDNHSEGMSGHVEDSTSLSLVVLVWHSLVESRVNLDINDVTSLVICHDLAQGKMTAPPEGLSE